MIRPRVIARLDVKSQHVVKGVHLEGLRQLGSPLDFATRYYQAGADELLYLDVVASLYGRPPNFDQLAASMVNVFVPVTYGGGIRTIDDVRTALRAGADKVAINTAAVADPDFIRRASDTFGASTLVLGIESSGGYVFTHGGRERHALTVLDHATALAPYVGEILLTSIDRDGMCAGPDLDQLKALTPLPISVVYSGGVATPEHVTQCISTEASGVAIGSALHSGAISVEIVKTLVRDLNRPRSFAA